MKNYSVDTKTSWNEASKSGLILGAVTSAYFVFGMLLDMVKGGTAVSVLSSVAGVLLWVAKFALCIYLMKFFMQKFAGRHPEADNSDTFRFGTRTALLSALIYSAVYLAWLLFIQPDVFSASVDMAIERYSETFTEEQIEQVRGVFSSLPAITFFFNLVYCWLFGTLLSAIFSRNIPPRNPFAGGNAEEQ